ncbi:DUF262 domain-containing protein [Commensalibacter papalotli (ex Servin-Garciduenas et al. 2014)]|uniref:GmrSD restriction endonucleases N-terminal domain-containing protein n=1 Tax=Commensalibacter papalotli (ex Servin-Garciduenas et al. 2014) TaxID=1208583 RepID=W7DUY3_9PROT|nr:DUF262 domain-containing protein [Commensalibacter papalotli (ex Servin-Garciduenas et al. 2014)]EUK18810.1 hypothetical protein COMX_03640 [Commensalibacter papalotli (ex Servin-Garciduenas et al. 2014)]
MVSAKQQLTGLEDDGIEVPEEEPIEYPNVTVNVHRDQYSIFQIKRKIEQKLLTVSPEFQRLNAWNNKQQSELIESILMGVPIPVFYFFEDSTGNQQIVDGKQRITALCSFLNNEFKLSKLKILGTKNEVEHFNGKFFGDLEAKWQSKIEDYQLIVFVIKPPTPENIKYDIFDRVNRGGTQLNAQEMRHALYNGTATSLLEELAKNEDYKKLTGFDSREDKRMKGRMMILRFIALYSTYQKCINIQYSSDMNEYLANFMKFINEPKQQNLITEIKNIFSLTMKNCYSLFGEDAFRFSKTGVSERRKPISMGLFEMVSYALACDIPTDTQKQKHIIDMIDQAKKYIEENNFFHRIDSKKVVDLRCSKAKEIQEKIRNIQMETN